MKLNKLTKGVFAAAALSAAGFANADAISEASLTIEGLSISFTDNNDNAVNPASISATEISFVNSNAISNANGVAGDSVTTDTDAFGGFNILNGISNGSAAAEGEVDFFGNLLAPGGATGSTHAMAMAVGSANANAGANITNSFDAEFDFVVNYGGGSPVDNGTLAGDHFIAALDFTWVAELFMEVWGQGGTSSYTFDFSVDIAEKDNSENKVLTEELNSDYLFDLAQIGGSGLVPVDGELDTLSRNFGLNTNGIFNEDLDTFTGDVTWLTAPMKWNTDYTVTITQNTTAGVTSVSEPASLAVFGLGLLGLAGAARRRKK